MQRKNFNNNSQQQQQQELDDDQNQTNTVMIEQLSQYQQIPSQYFMYPCSSLPSSQLSYQQYFDDTNTNNSYFKRRQKNTNNINTNMNINKINKNNITYQKQINNTSLTDNQLYQELMKVIAIKNSLEENAKQQKTKIAILEMQLDYYKHMSQHNRIIKERRQKQLAQKDNTIKQLQQQLLIFQQKKQCKCGGFKNKSKQDSFDDNQSSSFHGHLLTKVRIVHNPPLTNNFKQGVNLDSNNEQLPQSSKNQMKESSIIQISDEDEKPNVDEKFARQVIQFVNEFLLQKSFDKRKKIKKLDLSCNLVNPLPIHLRYLLQQGISVKNLEQIKLNCCKLGLQGVKQICKYNFPSLTFLDLCENSLGSQGLKKLINHYRNFPQLKEFIINKNEIGNSTLSNCSLLNFSQLSQLSLFENNLNDNHILQLFKKIQTKTNFGIKIQKLQNERPKFKNLKRLFLQNNQIGNEGIKILTQIEFPQLIVLSLSQNKINKVGIQYLVKPQLYQHEKSFVPFPKLQNLSLHSNNLCQQSMKTLTSNKTILKNLKILSLGNNKLEDDGISWIIREADAFPQLQRLYLNNINISSIGIQNFVSQNYKDQLKNIKHLAFYQEQFKNNQLIKQMLSQRFKDAIITID